MKKVLFIVTLFLFFNCKEAKKNTKKTTIQTLEKLTNFVDLKEEAFDITKYKGKKVLVSYWATWCGPCIKEMPDLLEAQKILAKENYVFFLISDEPIALISEFKKKTNYDFTFLKSLKPTSSIGVYALPTTSIYNEKGERVEQIIGVTSWSSEAMIAKLKQIK